MMLEVWAVWSMTAVAAGTVGGSVGFNLLCAMAVAALMPWKVDE